MSIEAPSNPPIAPAEPVVPSASTVLTSSAQQAARAAPSPALGVTAHRWRRAFLLAGGLVVLALGTIWLIPWVTTALNTVSTDDAYLNGHVTFVAPRVKGQVVRVLVDDNYRVKK